MLSVLGGRTYSRSLVRSMLQLGKQRRLRTAVLTMPAGAQVTVVCAGADDEGHDARVDRCSVLRLSTSSSYVIAELLQHLGRF